MTRQHATPVLIGSDGAVPLVPLSLGSGPDAVSEAELQQLLHEHPTCLPIAEIDAMFANPVPICTELNTPAGPIDNFLVTPTGLPVLVECKLWRNPEMRRQVVSQILDYAKELPRWSCSDLQREASRRLARPGNPLLDMVREAGHEVDEIDFNDKLTANLRRGRFLLLIVGDGIREGVEAITEYLQVHAGLHFTLGLVELPIFSMPDGKRVVVPRVLARTQTLVRTVVTAPAGMRVLDSEEESEADEAISEPDELDRKLFWTEFLDGLSLDDPEQRKANATNQGAIYFPLPSPGGTVWLTVFRIVARWEVGLFLSYTRGSDGERIVQRILEDWEAVREELGGTIHHYVDTKGSKSSGTPRTLIQDDHRTGPWTEADEKQKAFAWLRRRTNDFVNVLRPRVRSIADDIAADR